MYICIQHTYIYIHFAYNCSLIVFVINRGIYKLMHGWLLVRSGLLSIIIKIGNVQIWFIIWKIDV